MTTTKTGREIALERRAALSTFGKATSGQDQAAVASSETDITTALLDEPKRTLSARERRQRMSQTGQAHLPVIERTKAMVMKNSPQVEAPEVLLVAPRARNSNHLAQIPKSDAQRRREQLSKYGKAGLSTIQSPAMERYTL